MLHTLYVSVASRALGPKRTCSIKLGGLHLGVGRVCSSFVCDPRRCSGAVQQRMRLRNGLPHTARRLSAGACPAPALSLHIQPPRCLLDRWRVEHVHRLGLVSTYRPSVLGTTVSGCHACAEAQRKLHSTYCVCCQGVAVCV